MVLLAHAQFHVKRDIWRHQNCPKSRILSFFRPAFRSGSKCALIEKNKKLSYTRARECIVAKLRSVAPHLNLGTHSLRASGATTAANAEGVSDRLSEATWQMEK